MKNQQRIWRILVCGSLLCMTALRSDFVQAADVNKDILTVRQRMTADLAADVNDVEVPPLLAALKPDGSFSNLDYANAQVNDAWQPQIHLKRLDTLAGAYVSPASKFYHDASIKTAVISGIGFWLTKDFQNKNWFWNQIGVPGSLAKVLLVFWDDLTPAQHTKSIEILSRAKLGAEGTNLVWLSEIVAMRGVLQHDPTLMKSAFNKIANEIHLSAKQTDGQQPDGSFLYHGPLLYSWGYGCYFLRDNARIAALVAKTSFAFPIDKLKLIRDWTLDGLQWLGRGAACDFGADGREIARKGKDAKVLVDIGKDLAKLGAGRDKDIANMIARTNGDAGAQALVGNKQFWRADMMVHQRQGFYTSARMYSARTKNTEWGNGEALRSFYVADGCNVLMRTGHEYFDIFPVWDWQRIPGTTVELIPKFGPVPGKENSAASDAFIPNRNSIVHATKETFVGGVSDGKYGVNGGKFSRGTLHVNKAWFFFDNEYVCLGSGLSCDTDDDVITTLNQCFLNGDVQVADASAAHVIAKGKHDLPDIKWIANDGVCYFFNSPAHAHVDNESQSGSWSDISIAFPKEEIKSDVFKAWIDHGAHPANAGYAYTVIPNADEQAIQRYASNPQAVVVSNTADLQAVWQTQLKRGGAIFYKPGSVTLRSGLTVTLDQPAMLLVAETSAGVTVSLANPDNKPLTAHVSIDWDGKSTQKDIVLPGGGRAGSTVTMPLKF